MERTKIIVGNSEMSNLVGMFAFFIKEEKVKARIFIIGKADNSHFICQFISPFTGEPNVAKLLTIDELKDWVIIPSQELADEIFRDYCQNGWRYGVNY